MSGAALRGLAVLIALCALSARAADPTSEWEDARRRIGAAVREGQWRAVETIALRSLVAARAMEHKDQLTYILAESYMKQRRWEEAFATYEKARKLLKSGSLTSWSAQLRAAECQVAMRRLDKAEQRFNEIIAQTPFPLLRDEALIDKGNLLFQLSRDAEAQQIFQDLIQIAPYFRKDHRVSKTVASILIKTDSAQQAVDFLANARVGTEESEEGRDPAELMIESIAYDRLGNFALEDRDLQRTIRSPAATDSLKFEARYRLGENYRIREMTSLARKVFEFLDGKSGGDLIQARIDYSLGLVALAEGKLPEAIARGKAVLAKVPTGADGPQEQLVRARAHYLIGLINLRESNLREAQTHLEAAALVPTLSLDAKLRVIALHLLDKNYSAAVKAATEYLGQFQWGDQAGYALLMRGWGYQKAGNHDQAAQDFVRFFDKFPNHPAKEKALYLQALSLFERGKWQELVTVIGLAVRNQAPQDTLWQAGTLFAYAEGLFEVGRYSDALDIYRQLATRFPASRMSPHIYTSMAVSQARLGHYEDALASQKQALVFSKNFPSPDIIRYGILNLCSLAFNQHRYADALAYYDTFIKQFPPEDPLLPDVLYQSAFTLTRLKRTDEALSRWTAIVEKYPASPYVLQALTEIGRQQLQLGQDSSAQQTLSRLLDKAPQSNEAKEGLLLLAQSLFNQGDYQEASTRYEQFGKRYPNDERAKDVKKLQETSVYQLALSKRSTDIFLERYPHSPMAEDLYWEIGLKYLQKSDQKNALESFQKLALQFPDGEKTRRAFYLMGEIQFAQQNFPEAAASLKGFLQGDSPDPKLAPKAMFHLGVALFRQSLADQAAAAFQNLIKAFPDDPLARDAAYNLILSQQKAGKLDEAVEQAVRFLKLYPKATESDALWLQLGQMYKSLGNMKKAADAFKNVKKTSPDAIEATYTLGQMYQQQGDYRQAMAAYKRLLPLEPRDSDLRISGIALLAEAFEQVGEFRESMKLYQEVARFGKNPEWQKAAVQKIAAIRRELEGGGKK